jgi:hypothetical protein
LTHGKEFKKKLQIPCREPKVKQYFVDKLIVAQKNNSLILISVLFAGCSLAFQNCSSLQSLVFLSAPAGAQTSKRENPLSQMMNDSEEQIRSTRQKLEEHNDLFVEQRLEALKVGTQNKVSVRVDGEIVDEDTAGLLDLEGSIDIADSKRKIAAENQNANMNYTNDVAIEDFSKLKQSDKSKKKATP